jgi:hypothetical protein
MSVDAGPDWASHSVQQVRATRPRWSREVVLVVSLYLIYELIRAQVGASATRATRDGSDVLRWESYFHIDVERQLNKALTPISAFAVPACYFYSSAYLIVTISVLVWIYRKHSDEYVEMRTMLGVITAVALIGFWMFPAAPPRLLTNAGFIDTLTRYRAVGWWGSADSLPSGAKSIGNQFAAMPSLHVAWALWCAGVVQHRASHHWVRVTIWSYPALTTLVVIATANHYVLDAIAGAALWAIVTVAFTQARSSHQRLCAALPARSRPRRPDADEAG